MTDPKFIQNHSQEVPRPSGHQKTFKSNVEHPPEPPGAFRKNEEISAQTYHSDDFFDLKFSFSPCWRMCCPAGVSGEARGLSENIFPNIEDGRVFWVKRTFERAFVARKWKMRFLKPNTFRTPPDRFEYPFTYLNQGGTTQTAVEQVFWHPTFDTQKMTKIW